MKKIFFVILTFFTLATFLFANEKKYTPQTQDENWFANGTFYEMYIRSFYDSNGDNFGDFNGVIEKIDYLKSLGISAIWFLPINDSAEHTNNYDSVDYFNVDPTYGTMDEFKKMLQTCHDNDIKVILDLVPNHCSNEHPFFKDAANNKNSKYRSWFVWSDTKQKGYYETPTGYYYAYFTKTKPDFNYENPEVMKYFQSVMRYWLDIGVDGFRFDAVSHMTEQYRENIKYFRQFREVIEEEKYKDKELFLIAEASTIPYNEYLGNGNDSFHAVFNFNAASTLMRTVKNETPISNNVNIIDDLVRKYCKGKHAALPNTYLANLLTNHDSFTGQCRPFREFGANEKKAKLAASVYLTLPGIPFIYYGEEIGMDSNAKFKGDKFLRTCMQWTPEKNAGFTTGKPWNSIQENYQEYNIQTLSAREDSILNHYRKLISIRKNNLAMSIGSFESLTNQSKNDKIIAYAREFKDNKIIVIHSFDSKKASNIKFDLTGTNFANTTVENLLGNAKVTIKKNTLTISKLTEFETIIIKLK